MANKKIYSEKLLDPRWQKKRLEVFNRDKWTCLHCGDTTTTLNAHHLEYSTSGNPWDTPIESLQTLCVECHYIVEFLKPFILGIDRIIKDVTTIWVLCTLKNNEGEVVVFRRQKDQDPEGLCEAALRTIKTLIGDIA